jgi:hypothetical protein
MIQSQTINRAVKLVLISAAFASLAACNRQEAAKPVSIIDPNAELKQVDADIAKRLAEQKGKLEDSAAVARTEEDARRAAEAKNAGAVKSVADVRSLRMKWNGVMNEAGRTPKTEFAPVLAKMDAVKSEIQGFKGDECTENARITMLAGVSQGADTYREFAASPGDATPAMKVKLDDAATLLNRSDAELQTCVK